MTTGNRVTCEELVRELPDFLDRELPRARQSTLERHLEECARCLRKHRFEAAVLGQIRARLSGGALPPDLEARVLTLIGAAGKTDWA